MRFEYYILFNLVGFLIIFNLIRSTRRIDENVDYNNSQTSFIKPQNWMKRAFRLRSGLISKYIYIRSFTLACAILGIISSLIYFCTKNDSVANALMLIMIAYYVIDVLVFFVYSILYERKKSKNERS